MYERPAQAPAEADCTFSIIPTEGRTVTEDEYRDLANREMDDALRRAAHLVALIVVDRDHDEWYRELSRLGMIEDSLFCAMTTAGATKLAAWALAELPPDVARTYLMEVMANGRSWTGR